MVASLASDISLPLLLTLDIGTSSTRARVFDRAGRPVHSLEAQVLHEMMTTPDGGVEMPAVTLLDSAASALDQLLEKAGPSVKHIAAVGLCTFWHNLLGVDRQEQPLTPVYNWADTRSAGAVQVLRGRMDETAMHSRTGCLFHSSYWPAKLLWLSHARPQIFLQVRRWLSIGEYLFLRWFNEPLCTYSMASGTGLLDQNQCHWDKEVLAALPIDDNHLSPLCDVNTPVIGLKEPWRQRWPALQAVPWYPALGDGACNNLGSGCINADRLALMVGTSGAMRVLWPADAVKIPKGLWCYRADRRRFVMGGALSNGGNVFRWLTDHLRLGDSEAIEAAVTARPPDGHGLTILPFWAGERSPDWLPEAKASILGLTLNTKPMDILHATLEAIAYRFALIYQRLHEAAPQAEEIIASGAGLLRSPAWMQIMADVLGKPVVASAVSEASSRGVALLVLEAQGLLHDLAEAPAPVGQLYSPDPDRHARYQEGLHRHCEANRLIMPRA